MAHHYEVKRREFTKSSLYTWIRRPLKGFYCTWFYSRLSEWRTWVPTLPEICLIFMTLYPSLFTSKWRTTIMLACHVKSQRSKLKFVVYNMTKRIKDSRSINTLTRYIYAVLISLTSYLTALLLHTRSLFRSTRLKRHHHGVQNDLYC